MDYIISTLENLAGQTAFTTLTPGNYLMILVGCVFLYLAIKKEYEPLLLVPIAFGMILVNIYPDIMANPEDTSNGVGGLLHYFYILDEWSILPSLIFLDRRRIVAVFCSVVQAAGAAPDGIFSVKGCPCAAAVECPTFAAYKSVR